MKDIYIASFCHNGILGGALYFDDEKVTYRTNKLSVAPEYRNLEMPFENMVDVKTGWLLVFPTVSLSFKSGTIYKFIVFSRKSFIDRLRGCGIIAS